MSAPIRAELVEIGSGRRVPVTDRGVSAGGARAEITLRGIAAPVAFVDPTADGFVVTEAGPEALTVNDAPVIGQRLAQFGDQVAFGGSVYRIEPVAARPSAVRALLGWLLVIGVVAGSGLAGYLVAAMLRGGR